jgi:hypothetical protein
MILVVLTAVLVFTKFSVVAIVAVSREMLLAQ